MGAGFEELKVKLTLALLISYLDRDELFVVIIETLQNTVHYVLSRAVENYKKLPIYYASRALFAAESSHAASEREI